MIAKMKLNLMLVAALLTTYIDKFNEFSDAQAPTTGSTTSTYSFDTKGADIGTGEDTYLVIQVDTAVTSLGSATVDFKYVESDTADLGTPTTLASTGAVGKATLIAGYQALKMKIPANSKRYVGVIYTVATADLTAGAFSAFLTKDLQSAKTRTYASGYTV
jgi:hypothetical protein